MTPPNLILLITDQQREPRHWPTDQAWLDALMPNEAELRRTALSFTNGYAATAMCSPSRASLLTGRWPAEHGVTLTHTGADGGATPDPAFRQDGLREFVQSMREPAIPRRDLVRALVTSLTQQPDAYGNLEPLLNPATPNMARILERAGYTTYMKGKWHLTKRLGDEWAQADADAIAQDYGIHGWEPPDAGENTDPHHFGGGHAGRSGHGWDEDYIQQVERFLAEPPPAPWALIVSLVNPHDVLGYPSSFEEGGFQRSDWADLEDIGLPPTVDEDLSNKPYPHGLQRVGQTTFLGPLDTEEKQLDYVRFYAHLHRVVDEKVGRLLTALGPAEDPESLRSQTVVVRTSDHGEMGLSHGGLRQKMFTAYDEAINVPFVVSNPTLFPAPQTTDALASLCDVVPTFAGLAGVDTDGDGLRGHDLGPVLAHHAAPQAEHLAVTPVDLSSVTTHPAPAPSVQEQVHFTFDDDKSGSAFRDVSPPPNHIRAVRTTDAMYAVYVDPAGRAAPQYELYDTGRDPDQTDNLVDRHSGRVLRAADEPLRADLHARLLATMAATRTTPPVAAGVPAR
jgi:arylsulfatase A-like enzyme